MIELGPPFPPTWYGRPPGMPDPDVLPWHNYLARNAERYTRLYYNVRLTTADPARRFEDPTAQAVATALLPKRIDVLAETVQGLELIEVSARPGLRAIGQLISYRALWKALHPEDPRPVRLVLVCQSCDPDELLAAAAAGIDVARA